MTRSLPDRELFVRVTFKAGKKSAAHLLIRIAVTSMVCSLFIKQTKLNLRNYDN